MRWTGNMKSFDNKTKDNQGVFLVIKCQRFMETISNFLVNEVWDCFLKMCCEVIIKLGNKEQQHSFFTSKFDDCRKTLIKNSHVLFINDKTSQIIVKIIKIIIVQWQQQYINCLPRVHSMP